MKIAEYILYRLANAWSDSWVQEKRKSLGVDASSEQFNINYALRQQYDRKVIQGLNVDIRGKTILEIGCGHGGISTFLAVNGAKKVIGIDLNIFHLEIARKFARHIGDQLGKNVELPVEFLEMNAYEMTLPPASFDLVLADNVFEHFMEPEKVMQQSYKLLKPGGILMVPIFSSIYSKQGLHLKTGLKVPWANLFFSEKTICNVMAKRIKEDPWLENIYPGYKNNPEKVRDLRKYNDLNDITYGKFKRMAKQNGFNIKFFRTQPTPLLLGKIINKIPIINQTLLIDIFSFNAGAILEKA